MYQSEMFLQKTVKQNFWTTKPWNSGDPVGFICQYHPRKTKLSDGLCINMANYACLHNSSHQIIGTHCNFVQKTCYSLCPEIQKWKLKCIIWAWLEVGLGLDKLRASEPASHASWASESCESSCEPLETDVSSQSIFLGYLARVFAILALLWISFCYLPSSFVKVSYVICYYFSRVLNR